MNASPAASAGNGFRSALRRAIESLESRLLLTTFQPADGPALSQALTDAQLGDTIILNAGSTYTGDFVLKNKTTGSGWITIESSNLASLPAGVRVSPSDAGDMPKLQSPGGNANVVEAQYPAADGSTIGAHHFKFLGIEFVGPADNTDVTSLMQLGTTDGVQNTLSEMPHDFVVDRCYFHPNANTAQVRRAIALNSGATDVTNSYIEEIHQNGSDSQAIGGSNGAGPYNITNNFLEAASENILFGGSASFIPNTIPSNITIRGNYFYKPTSWMGTWDVKNLFELKVGKNVDIEGNIFENNWNSAQDGTAILFKLDQWSASRPWQVTQDVTFKNNIVRHSANAVALQGRDYTNGSPPGDVKDLTITNNVFDDINKTPWATWKDPNAIGGNLLYITQGPQNVTFTHNTVINGRTTINVDTSNKTYPASGFIYQNNIAANNTYGVWSDLGMGDPTITSYFDNQGGGTFTKNVLMGGPASKYTQHPGNYFPTTWAAVGFTDQANGDFSLVSSSPYKNAGTDGTDIGVNMADINDATAGAISGVWPAQGVLLAEDGFADAAGGLTGNGGGSGFGSNLWTTESGRQNGTVSAGSMAYSDGVNNLLTSGNKVTTTGNSRNWRILGSPVTLNASNPDLWVAFVGRANSTGTGHVGVCLSNGSQASTSEIVTLGKGASVANWGFAGVTHGTDAQSSTPATTQAFLVYEFIYGSGGTATAKLWVNPSLNGTPTGTPSATTTLSNFSFDRLRVSSGSGNFGDLDEIRIGTAFSSVAPVSGLGRAAPPSTSAEPAREMTLAPAPSSVDSVSTSGIDGLFSSTQLSRDSVIDAAVDQAVAVV